MDSRMSKVSNQSQPLVLLALPRELRDQILELVLVPGRIPIECAITSAPKYFSPDSDGGTEEDLLAQYPLRQPCESRKTWTVPLIDLEHNTRIRLLSDDGEPWPWPKGKRCNVNVDMTYQLSADVSRLDLDIMRACKQLYTEACKIFYAKNKFAFSTDLRIPSALHFLEDRPAISLSYVRYIELALTESGHGPELLTNSNAQRHSYTLRYGYEHYQKLCSLISSPVMRVWHLDLFIESFSEYVEVPVTPTPIQDYLLRESRLSIDIPDWLYKLIDIKDLRSVSVRWLSHYPCLQRAAKCLDLIRRQMLLSRHMSIHPEVADVKRVCVDNQVDSANGTSSSNASDARYTERAQADPLHPDVDATGDNNETRFLARVLTFDIDDTLVSDMGAVLAYTSKDDHFIWEESTSRLEGPRLTELRLVEYETSLQAVERSAAEKHLMSTLTEEFGTMCTVCFAEWRQ